jgi:hypothetical protein
MLASDQLEMGMRVIQARRSVLTTFSFDVVVIFLQFDFDIRPIA